jgi:type IV pilus assembly protein PilB
MNPLSELTTRGTITDAVARQVEQLVTDERISYEEGLLRVGISPELVRSYYAEHYHVPIQVLAEGQTIPQEILNFIPQESAAHYRMVPLGREDDVLIVGVNDPEDIGLREALNFISTKHNVPYKMVFMLDRDIADALRFYENLTGEVSDALGSFETELDAEIAAGAEDSKEETKKALEHIEADAPVTKIVATILRYAVDGGASDIHIEPRDQKVFVRFRVDGSLATSLELPKAVHSAVVARVKILSSMRLDERRRPQDGRFSAMFDKRKIDFRVSLLPTNFGEKVVMRILDNTRGVAKLEDTGILPHHLEAIRKMKDEPYGIILISGPTGSGKSTTLYALLSEVDRITKNVLSLEDPVEYNIDGVSQSQVRPEIGYTFAAGLRAALRQDPDIIMVGEIRDKETAQLAIQAALTGHLVLSTIHTNNAIGVVPRLIDMGVDPYLIAPTLKLAIAQRLARRVYKDTGRTEPVSKSMQVMMDETFKTLPKKHHDRIPAGRTVVHPQPSPQSATGLKGRVAIMEVLEVNDEIQELILKNGSEEQMFNVARAHGFMTMQEDAIIKALNHVIPYEEMNAFGSKAGVEFVVTDDEAPAVDNPAPVESASATMDGNEDTTG